MKAGPGRRTLFALMLTIVAIAVPCGYWFVAGSQAVQSQQHQLLERPERRASAAAGRMATRVAARLEALVEVEGQRPWYHYQNLYVDPRAAYEGKGVAPSPLADGPGDPIIAANFEIDAAGELNLPTLNPELSVLNDARALPRQQRLRTRLAGAVQPYLARLSLESVPAAAASGSQPPVKRPADSPQVGEAQQRQQLIPPVQEQRLSANAYLGNTDPNQLYYAIQTKKGVRLQQPMPRKGRVPRQQSAVALNGEGEVVVKVGPLLWHAVPASGSGANRPGRSGGEVAGSDTLLVALRSVETPDGERTQGFEVELGALDGLLTDEAATGTLVAGPAAGPGVAQLGLRGAPWHVRVDFAEAATEARLQAAGIGAAFHRRFVVGTLLASLAGLLVVLMIWHGERLSAQRVRFAASAAHELRTPLAGLRMYGEMLAEGLGDPAKRQLYARRVANEAERLGRVVSNVLDFTRLERGSLAVSVAPGDLGEATRAIVERMRPAISATGASVELDIADALPPVRFDRDALAQVLANLLDNAEKYSRQARDRTISVRVAATADGVSLSVSDRGPGVGARDAKRLFSAFQRGDSGADRPAGLGLGLALTRALVRAQGGDIRYLHREEGGATFEVTLS